MDCRIIGHRSERLAHRHGFPGQRGLIDRQFRDRKQSGIGRNLIARLENDNIAGH